MKNTKKSTDSRLLIATGPETTDVRYATGLVAPDPFGLLIRGSRHYLLVSALEAARAHHTCPTAIIQTPAQLFPDTIPQRQPWEDQVVEWVRQLGCRSVQVGAAFPLGTARALEQGGIRVELVQTPPFPQRAIKSPQEISCITRSQRAAAAAMRAAINCIRSSEISRSGLLKVNGRTLTSEQLKEIIGRTLWERNCSDDGTIVAIGPQGARPHDSGSGPLREGQPVVIDIFPRDKSTGYWGDMTRTVVRGKASASVRRLHRDVAAAQKLALSMLRPGVESRAVQKAVESFFREAGHETRLFPPGQECGFIHSVGHGVGLDIHESPGLRNEPGRLIAGNVVTVEPGLYVPGLGGARIEDTVVVTCTGHKSLASCSKKLAG